MLRLFVWRIASPLVLLTMLTVSSPVFAQQPGSGQAEEPAAPEEGDAAATEQGDGAPEETPQPEPVSPKDGDFTEATPAQLEMNEKAIQAVERKEFDKAIDLFEASIRLGELNITYLNMGRTYAKMNECVKAKEIYRKARQTPYKVPNPPPNVVSDALNTYESELYESCPYGELVVSCKPKKLDLYVNTRGPYECPGEDEPMRLQEGEYVLKGTFNGYEGFEVPVSIQRVDRVRATMTLAKKVEDTPPVVKEQPEEQPRSEPEPEPAPEKSQPQIIVNVPEQPRADEDSEADATLKAEAAAKKRRRNIGAGIMLGVGAGMVVGALAYDSCGFQWSTIENRGAGYEDSLGPLCGPQINRQIDGADFIGPGGYLVGGILMLTGLLRFEF